MGNQFETTCNHTHTLYTCIIRIIQHTCIASSMIHLFGDIHVYSDDAPNIHVYSTLISTYSPAALSQCFQRGSLKSLSPGARSPSLPSPLVPARIQYACSAALARITRVFARHS